MSSTVLSFLCYLIEPSEKPVRILSLIRERLDRLLKVTQLTVENQNLNLRSCKVYTTVSLKGLKGSIEMKEERKEIK